jgi:glycosyltransferase involved in cell wall biosynthesis
MKICYLANAQSVHTQRWAKHFLMIGHQVKVISLDPAEIENIEVIVPPHRTSDRRLNILLNISKILRLVHQIRPDILHAHYVTSYGFVGSLTGTHPYIVTAWGSDVLIEPEKSWLYRRIVGFALGRADLVTSMAPHMTELMLRRKYAAEDKIVTLPFGVDTDVFNLERRTRPHGSRTAIVVSTRRPDYGLDVDSFVRAVPAVMKVFEDTRFIVIGEGPLRKSIERLAADLGLAGRIEFRGEISHREMPELLGMADVFVSTSPSDGNNISLNEAMACGAFPVATDIPANRVWVESGQNGFLYPCRDVDRLADRIIEALLRPDWREKTMNANWDIVRKGASWAKSMEEAESHYRRLIEKKDHH